MSYDVPDLDWAINRVLPAFQDVQSLDLYDIRGATKDVQLAIASFVGLLNRPLPNIYIITNDDDLFWLTQIPASIPQNVAPQSGDVVLSTLLNLYQSQVRGLIVYDPALPDTINIATTLAGQRDALIVSPALLQDMQTVHQLSILMDLRTFKWRNRVEAYQWALHTIRNSSSSRLLAGLDPTGSVWLRSFLVATSTFVYWLDSRYAAQAERRLMQQIIDTFPSGSSHLGWFIHESSGVALTSQAAMTVFATDWCTNLEVWSAIQPASPERPVQAVKSHAVKNKVYVSFTISDGDNIQYCQHYLLRLWRDSARGSVPIGWTMCPALLQFAPVLADYYLNSASPNDELIAGPSGAGYIFPSRWPAASMTRFLQQTGELMREMNMTTLQVLDSDWLYRAGLPLVSTFSLTGMAFTRSVRQQKFASTLAPYGLRGLLSGTGMIFKSASWKGVSDLPCYTNLGLADIVETTVRLIRRAARTHKQRPYFLNLYILAWRMTPSQLKRVQFLLGDEYEIVLPRTLLSMLASTPEE